MQFMIRASLTIHVPLKTVFMEHIPHPVADEEDEFTIKEVTSNNSIMSLDTLSSDMQAKVGVSQLVRIPQPEYLGDPEYMIT